MRRAIQRFRQKWILEIIKGTDMEIPVTLAACCGLRRSEICGLKWSNINFKRETITICTALVLDENLKYVEKGTKTTASKRTIALMPQPLAALRAKYNECSPAANETITTLTPNMISRRFTAMLKKATFTDRLAEYLYHLLPSDNSCDNSCDK